jgi:hypothetical protein
MKAFVVASCVALLASPVLAQPSGGAASGDASAATASPSPAAAGANANGDHARAEPRQICRRIDSDVSRRIGSRLVCHTAQEWRALQDQDQG